MSITDSKEFIKSLAAGKSRDVAVLGIIAFSAIGSFALGRLSALESGNVYIEQRAAVGAALVTDSSADGPSQEFSQTLSQGVEASEAVVASKNGTKYHFPWCAGAQSIKEENKIWFDSTAQARAAGYTPASNCKGLK